MAEKTVEQRCYEALKARGVTFAAAESCTGGLIAKRITDVPGASGVFMGDPFERRVRPRHAERARRLRILAPQLQKRRKHGKIAQKQHHEIQREKAPEE